MDRMTDAITCTATALEAPPLVPALIEPARAYAQEAKANATRRAYRVDWQAFDTWCAEHHVDSLPAKSEVRAGEHKKSEGNHFG